MIISRTMCTRRLAEYMGSGATEDDAHRMRELLTASQWLELTAQATQKAAP